MVDLMVQDPNQTSNFSYMHFSGPLFAENLPIEPLFAQTAEDENFKRT